jgi:hypothetical protein
MSDQWIQSSDPNPVIISYAAINKWQYLTNSKTTHDVEYKYVCVD